MSADAARREVAGVAPSVVERPDPSCSHSWSSSSASSAAAAKSIRASPTSSCKPDATSTTCPLLSAAAPSKENTSLRANLPNLLLIVLLQGWAKGSSCPVKHEGQPLSEVGEPGVLCRDPPQCGHAGHWQHQVSASEFLCGESPAAATVAVQRPAWLQLPPASWRPASPASW